ncbi:MAG: LytR C-terminal domain-containing protein [Acidimicrobiia bacterium]
MSEPRHRRSRSSGGRRRRVAIQDHPPSVRELDRAARRTEAGRRRRRLLLAAGAALVMVGAAVGGSWLLFSDRPQASDQVVRAGEEGASLLVVITGEDGRARSLTLVVAHPEAAGRVVLFPPGLIALLPGYDERPIADAPNFGAQPPLLGSAELAGLTIMNLLGVRVDAVTLLGVADLEGLLPARLTVDLPVALQVEQDGGEVVAVTAGSAQHPPAMVGRLLASQGTGDQLAWLERQGAVWEALLNRVATDPGLVAGLTAADWGDPTDARAALTGAGEDPDLVLTALQVSRVAVAGPDPAEYYTLASRAVSDFVAVQVPFLRLGEEQRTRVEILNGNGRIGTTQPVAELLIGRGFRVIRTDNADRSDYETTQVIAQGLKHQQAAIDIRRLLATGEVLAEQRQPSTVVDVTIILGEDAPT